MREVIRVEDISFSYGGSSPVLEGVSFSVEEGEFLCIVGPNGAGKTTLLRIILGLLKPLSGRVSVMSKSMGYAPQRLEVESLFPGTVWEILRSSGGKVSDLVDRLHLEGLVKRRFTELSGGERRKVLLALAFSSDPDTLLLDEPTAGLDAHTTKHVEEILREVKGLKTVLLVSHDVRLVSSLADRVLCLNRRVHYFGPPEEVPALVEDLFGIGGV